MGANVSQFKDVADALNAGKTQKEVDEFLAKPISKGNGLFMVGNATFENAENMKIWSDVFNGRKSNGVKVGGSEAVLKTGDLSVQYIAVATPEQLVKASGMNAEDFKTKPEEGKAFAAIKTWDMHVMGNVTEEVKKAMEPWSADPRIKISYTDTEIVQCEFKNAEDTKPMMMINQITAENPEQLDLFLKHHKITDHTFNKNECVCIFKLDDTHVMAIYMTNETEWAAQNESLKTYQGLMEWMGAVKNMDSVLICNEPSDAVKSDMEEWGKNPQMNFKMNPESVMSSTVRY